MKKGFVVSAVLYPLLVIALALIMGVISMSDNRRKILDNMKLEVSEESESDPEMTNSNLYYKIKALEEAYGELNARFSEEYFDQIKADYEAKIKNAKTELTNSINSAKSSAISTAKLQAFPVGSIFTSTTSTNPSSYIGGTWQAYGQGRTLIGTGSNGTTNYSLGATGGSETHTHTGTVGGTTLTTSQIPSHTHSIPSLSGKAASAGNHNHQQYYYGWYSVTSSGEISVAFNKGTTYGASTYSAQYTNDAGAHEHNVTTTASTTGAAGGGSSHTHSFTGGSSSNIQPYVVVYFWKRTA